MEGRQWKNGSGRTTVGGQCLTGSPSQSVIQPTPASSARPNSAGAANRSSASRRTSSTAAACGAYV